jgi:hypothetical protein
MIDQHSHCIGQRQGGCQGFLAKHRSLKWSLADMLRHDYQAIASGSMLFLGVEADFHKR